MQKESPLQILGYFKIVVKNINKELPFIFKKKKIQKVT